MIYYHIFDMIWYHMIQYCILDIVPYYMILYHMTWFNIIFSEMIQNCIIQMIFHYLLYCLIFGIILSHKISYQMVQYHIT